MVRDLRKGNGEIRVGKGTPLSTRFKGYVKIETCVLTDPCMLPCIISFLADLESSVGLLGLLSFKTSGVDSNPIPLKVGNQGT